jgi:hypothetical protein
MFWCLAVLAGAAMAQESTVFKTAVSLVHVDAEVTDGTRLLTGFHKEDFQVFDNGSPQKILYFSAGETPLDLVLLFEVEQTINEKVLPARGGTHILRAVSDAAAYFLKEPRTERRRAVLIVTDNHGQPSGHRDAVVRNLWEADALLSGLELRWPGEGAMLAAGWVLSPQTAWMQMENMTSVVEKTGGDLVKGHDPRPDFEEMIRRLRLRYMLVYALPQGKPGEERKIRVQLSGEDREKNPKAQVRARDGYCLPK